MMARPAVRVAVGTSSVVMPSGRAVCVTVQISPVPSLPTSASAGMAAPLLVEDSMGPPRTAALAGAASPSESLPLPLLLVLLPPLALPFLSLFFD